VAVAKYIDYTIYAHPSAMPNDSIPIVKYIYDNPATLTNFKSRIDSIPMVLEYYSDLFGLYPFAGEKYGHYMAPFSGGMEHQTMTSIGNLGSLEAFTGKNLIDYFSQWLYGEGYPVYSTEYASDGNNLFVKITHITSSPNTTLFKTPLEIKCSTTVGDTTIRVDITQNSNTFMIPSGRTITNLSIDPNNWLLNKTGSITKNPNLIPTSLSSINLENAIRVYSNPVTDQLNIENSSSLTTTYSLCDMNSLVILNDTLLKKNIINLYRVVCIYFE